MLIYLDDYRRAMMKRRLPEKQFDEELLCVNWNPAVSALAMTSYRQPSELSPQLPLDFSTVDVEAFLDRIYALATQV